MLNPSGNNHGSVSPTCAGIPAKYRPEYNHEKQECFKEISIPTPVLPIFERLQSLNKPLVSAHMVEMKRTQTCISKQKIRICSGQSDANRSQGMKSSMPLSLKSKLVEYVCISRPTSMAQSLEKRAKSGETLSLELNKMPTAFSKMEYEPVLCGPAKSSEMGGRIEYAITGEEVQGGSGMGGRRRGSGSW